MGQVLRLPAVAPRRPPEPLRELLAQRGCVVAGAVGELLAVLAPLFAHGLRRRLGDVLAALEGLLAGLLGLVLDPIGDRAELLVLDVRARNGKAHEETGGDCADSEPERVLLRDAKALLHGADGVRRPILRARLDVGLVAQRVDGLSHALAGVDYLVADRVRVFAHCTSSFTDSMVSSGTGGAAAWT